MASGGEITSSYYNNNSAIKFAWQIQSQDIANNSTTIYYQLRGVRTTSGYVEAGNFSIKIDGNTWWSSATRINMYNDTLITEGTFTLTHNADGSRNFTIYIEAGIYTIAVNVSGSQTFALTGIPRQATIKSFSVSVQSETSVKYSFTTDSTLDWAWYSTNGGSSWNNLPANNIITGLSAGTTYNFKLRVRRQDSQLTTDSGTVQKTTYKYPYITKVGTTNLTIGNSQTLTLYNPLSRSVTIKMYKTSTSGTQLYSGSTSGTTITFTPSSSTLYASIPNATSANAVYAAIYSGTRTTSGTYTYKVNTSTNAPTFSNFTYEDTNSTAVGITGNNQTLIKGISTLAVTISSSNKMVAKNSATAKNYTFVIDTKNVSANYSSSGIVKDLGTIANSGTKRLTVTAYDSRNLSTAVYKNVTVYDYSKPVVNFSATRQNNFENDTTLQISGTYSRLTINNTDKNAIQQVQYRYREKNGTWSNYITATMTAANGVFSCQDIILDLDNTKEFEIEVRATDLLSTTTVSTIVGSGQAILFISSNEKKVYYNNNEVEAIVDAGTNENGKYIKYNSGLMICTKEVTFNCAINSAWGNLYQSPDQSIGNYAQEFINTPTISATANTPGYAAWVGWVEGSTKTSFGTCSLLRPSAVTTSQNYPIHFTAIGYWKIGEGGGGGGGTPTGLAPVAISGDYYDLINRPDFAAVATSGSYADLTNTPTIDDALSSSSTNAVQNKVINTALGNKAPLASPALTGTPTAPTAAAGTNTTQISTTAFVKTAIDNALAGITSVSFQVVNSLPATGQNGVIYLISNSGTSPNIYDEYIWVNNAFEKIGTTDIDLSGFVEDTDMIAITNAEIDSICV